MAHDPRLPNLHADARRAGGDIAGPGGLHERGGVVIDGTNAVLLDNATVSLVDSTRGGQHATEVAVLLEGRINKTTTRSRVLYITNADGVAALITELFGLAERAAAHGDVALAEELMRRFEARWKDLPR